jgi:hypothetical protein
MKRVLIYSALAIGVLSCSKDSFETTPTLEYKSSNTDIVPQNSDLRVELSYTDKEGDLDSATVYRKRLNKRGPLTASPIVYSMPAGFENQPQGDVVLTLDYTFALTLQMNAIIKPGSSGQFEPDTLELGFQVKDKAKNVSDTVKRIFIVIR